MIEFFDVILWLTHAFYLVVLFVQEMAYRAQYRHLKDTLKEQLKDRVKETENTNDEEPLVDTPRPPRTVADSVDLTSRAC